VFRSVLKPGHRPVVERVKHRLDPIVGVVPHDAGAEVVLDDAVVRELWQVSVVELGGESVPVGVSVVVEDAATVQPVDELVERGLPVGLAPQLLDDGPPGPRGRARSDRQQ